MDIIQLFDRFRNENDLSTEDLDILSRHCGYLVENIKLEESLNKSFKGFNFKIDG